MNKMITVGAVALALLATSAHASTVDTDGLNAAQSAKIEAEIAQTKADNVSQRVDKPVVQKVNEWVQVGQGVGAGLVSAAKELGVEANKFATTPLGQITVAIIIWKVMGADIVHLIIGLLWLFTLMPLWTFFYLKAWAPIIEEKFGDDGKRVSRETTPYKPGDETYYMRILGLVPYVAILLFGLAILP